MTPAQKIGQLYQLPGWQAYQRVAGQLLLTEEIRQLLQHGLGSLYGLFPPTPGRQ